MYFFFYLCRQKPDDMSNFVIYLPLQPFVRQYLFHHFGNPVRFDDKSVTNSVIRSFLMRRDQETEPVTASDDLTPICIPYSKQKDPLTWNHITEKGKKAICQHINGIFMMNLWNEMNEMCREDSKVKLQTAAFAWCEMHGIDIDYADTIRMKYYREKMKFLKHSIDLRSKKRKHEN